MTTFSFTTGNPAHLTAGAAASMTDIGGSFTDVQTFINGGNIDTSNLATSAKPVTLLGQYRLLHEANSGWNDTLTASTRFFVTGSVVANTTVNQSPNSAIPQLFHIYGADHSVSGLTAKLRARFVLGVNQVAPAITFTAGLYPASSASSAADQYKITLGTVVTGSTAAFASPAANSTTTTTTSDFSLPTDGLYVLGVVISGAPTADSAGFISGQIQVHHI